MNYKGTFHLNLNIETLICPLYLTVLVNVNSTNVEPTQNPFLFGGVLLVNECSQKSLETLGVTLGYIYLLVLSALGVQSYDPHP